MGDYFGHWLEVGATLSRPPKIFRVNWFRTDDDGRMLWPGFGDNLRVLQWILERCDGRGDAEEAAIGWIPTRDAINRDGLDLSDAALAQLLKVDPAEWVEAIAAQERFLDSLGDRVPAALRAEHTRLSERLRGAPPAS
jgi:phosphoenolpyruvate carboxykinase (GTP)